MYKEPVLLANLDIGKSQFVHLLHYEEGQIAKLIATGRLRVWDIRHFSKQLKGLKLRLPNCWSLPVLDIVEVERLE